MKESISTLLRSLYGLQAGLETARAVEGLLQKWAAPPLRGSAPPEPAALTESDALLITYADQLREPGRSPLQTLAAFCEQHLQGVVSGVHLLPFYPWSSDDGFSVMDYFAVDPACGSWEDVEQLGRSFGLMFDGVFNHLSIRSDWFQRFLRDEPEFREFFVTVEGDPDLSQVVRPRALPLLTSFQTAAGRRRVWTTFSADQADLNFQSPRVLLAVLEALLFYAGRGARFIRLDAIAFLWKEIGTPCLHLPQTHALIRLMRAVLDEAAPHVRLITETNVPHADNISYFGDGANEAQMVYNFALPPLVLHAFTSGSAAALTRWAATLRTPSKDTAFFNFLASHDGIGLNPARGILGQAEIDGFVARALRHGGLVSYKQNPDGSQSPYELNVTWFDALNDPAADEPLETQVNRFMASQAIMLALAGVPGIYFHSLFGARNDRAAAEAAGIARRINRRKLDRAELERCLADPASLPARVFSRYCRLLRARRRHAAFHPQAGQEVLALDERVFALRRASPDGAESVLCLHNVSGGPVSVALSQARAPAESNWSDLLHPSPEGPCPGRSIQPGSCEVQLGPYEVVWLRHARSAE